MKTFGGEFSKQQKVSLSGRSKSVAESRQEILERTRRERDARRQRKAEEGAALYIQSAWRSYRSRVVLRDKWRQTWIQRWGHRGEYCVNENLYSPEECMRMIVMYVDPFDFDDVERFACACGMYCDGIESHDIFWMKYVLQMSAKCLSAHRDVFAPYMREPWMNLKFYEANEGNRTRNIGKKLIQGFLLSLSLQTGKGNVDDGILEISMLRMCLRVQKHHYRELSIFHDVADNVRVACSTSQAASNGEVPPMTQVTSAETMLTALLVYSLSKDNGYQRILSSGLIKIFLVDSIFDRCPSLVPLATKIWRKIMAAFEESSALDMREIVPQEYIQSFLTNLVSCLEYVMGNRGGGHDALGTSLVPFMTFVEGVLEDKCHWNVSAKEFVHPLAEANVMVALVKAFQKKAIEEGDLRKRREIVETVCRFVTRLLSYSNDAMVQTKITLTLAVKGNFANLLWNSYLNEYNTLMLTSESYDKWMPVMILFCETCVASLNVLGDDGFYDKGIPLPISQVYDTKTPQQGVLFVLKEMLWKLVWRETSLFRQHTPYHPELQGRFVKSGGKLLTLLHDKNGRRAFAPQEAFYANDLPRESFHAAAVAAIDRRDIEKMHSDLSSMGDDSDSENESPSLNKVVEILQYAYPLVPFIERVRIFQSIVISERRKIGNDESISGVLFGGMSRDRFITVHRGRVLEDAFSVLGMRRNDVDVKKRIRISFINEFGENEAGIDGGGVFKEFLECIVKESISPSMGLFQSTMDNKLYPSPIEHDINAHQRIRKMEFVGMMIGKALWEGILLELPLATFFLKKMRGTAGGVDDLPSLDPELAKHLSYLMQNPSIVNDLGLTFSITQSSMGKVRDIELIPGGSNIPVTSANVAHFIHRTADYRLNQQIKSSSDAFLRGFHAIIPKEWVASFNDCELQMLIGGAEGASRLDLNDLKNHVVYTGGYNSNHPVIERFWSVLNSFSNGQLADFLRFVTSCPRPPILGFGSLEPPLTIQMTGSDENDATDRLPTAATCVNLLKLPPYRTEEMLKSKLLYSVEAHAGFDLS